MSFTESSYYQTCEEQKTLFNEILNSVERVQAKVSPSSEYLRARLGNLGSLWEQCRKYNAFLKANAPHTDERDHQDDVNLYDPRRFKEIESAYYECTDYILENLSDRHDPELCERVVRSDNSSPLKLPRISIPVFSGAYTEWLNFRDLFESLVTQNDSLDDAQRLHYLKSYLSGEALIIVENQPASSDNFEKVWDALKSRYNNNKTLINEYLKMFNELPEINSDFLASLKNMRDTVLTVTLALTNLNLPVDQWDTLLVFILQNKLDKVSINKWEMENSERVEFPTFSDFMKFLDSRIRALEAMQLNKRRTESKSSQSTSKNQKSTIHAHQANQKFFCHFCKGEHKIINCVQFKNLPVDERESYIHKNNRCTNCLAKHNKKVCLSQKTCLHCGKKHNTLLHRQASNFNKNEQTAKESENSNEPNDGANLEQTFTSHLNSVSTNQPTMLATARVVLAAPNGRKVFARALLDPCSEFSFISENLVQLLRLQRERNNATIESVGGTRTRSVSHSVSFHLQSSKFTNISITTRAFVLSKITSFAPISFVVNDLPSQFRNLEFADPCPYSTGSIELLIGADIYGLILKEGVLKGTPSALLAQETIFGWVLSGPLKGSDSTATIRIHHVTNALLNTTLQQFWQLEEVPKETSLSVDDLECESQFASTHTRDSNGRYIVKLPLGTPPFDIGDSKKVALSAFQRLEKKLDQNPSLKKSYCDFMSDYQITGHMSEVPQEDDQTFRVYIPHHPVLREESSTTKLRVVFNASSHVSSNKSLNDCLYIGQKLQNDLIAIILRWRLHPYVSAADIKQMFRQILVSSEDRRYQSILWRENSKDRLKVFELNTVTYGMASSSFLANRVFKQLAEDERQRFPLGASVLENDTYVDDVFLGGNDKRLVIEQRNQTIELTKAGGMTLRKWSSNSVDLLHDLETMDHCYALEFPFEENSSLKILGIHWNPTEDSFCFHVKETTAEKLTKKHILSSVGKLFDPLGWLLPMIIKAKILLQSLWLIKVSWDEELPSNIINVWRQFQEELPSISKLKIPRWTGLGHDALSVESHGFGDAPKSAYAAVIYSRVVLSSGEIKINLLIAKTKVAPIKTVSIPRLELCAASLLAKLTVYLMEKMRLFTVSVYCWIDSRIVLDWLQKQPSTWPVFVANRVSQIQTALPNAQWLHVLSKDNPADCASRGSNISSFLNDPLWWKGPKCLSENHESWSKYEPRVAPKIHTWAHLLRITAYILRFVHFIKLKEKLRGPLSGNEVEQASNFWVRYAQRQVFSKGLNCINKQLEIPPSSPLRKLNSFVDESGVLRLGRRLRLSSLSNKTKFPAILPKHRVATLITEQLHKNLLHAGTQLTLSVLREKFWIIGVRNLVKKQIFNCVTCTRDKARINTQFMADLPTARCSPSRLFTHTGIDYA